MPAPAPAQNRAAPLGRLLLDRLRRAQQALRGGQVVNDGTVNH